MFDTKYKIVLDRWGHWCLYKRNWWSPFWHFIVDFRTPEAAAKTVEMLRTPPTYL